jgi:hypothetical protein
MKRLLVLFGWGIVLGTVYVVASRFGNAGKLIFLLCLLITAALVAPIKRRLYSKLRRRISSMTEADKKKALEALDSDVAADLNLPTREKPGKMDH